MSVKVRSLKFAPVETAASRNAAKGLSAIVAGFSGAKASDGVTISKVKIAGARMGGKDFAVVVDSPMMIQQVTADAPASVDATHQALASAMSNGTLATTLFSGKVVECDVGRDAEKAVCHIAIPNKTGIPGTLSFVGSAKTFDKQRVLFRLDASGQIVHAMPAKDAVAFTGLVSKVALDRFKPRPASTPARKQNAKLAARTVR